MLKYMALSLGIIVAIQIGCFLTEKVMECMASKLGYNASYARDIGRLSFSNPDMRAAFKSVMNHYGNDSNAYVTSTEWKELQKMDTADRAQIVLSGKIFTSLVSAIGLAFFFLRRRQKLELVWQDWLGLIFGFLFMRDTLINTVGLATGFILCHDAKLWESMGLPVLPTFRIYTLLGFLLCGIIIFSIPKGVRLMFVVSGLTGLVAGGMLWLFFTGNFLLHN